MDVRHALATRTNPLEQTSWGILGLRGFVHDCLFNRVVPLNLGQYLVRYPSKFSLAESSSDGVFR
jgi:hypothetical protein